MDTCGVSPVENIAVETTLRLLFEKLFLLLLSLKYSVTLRKAFNKYIYIKCVHCDKKLLKSL